jgi:soluble lytic murein transglycosylase
MIARERSLHEEIGELRDTIDFLNSPKNEKVVVVNENLKSKQERTRLKLEDIVATSHYSTMTEEKTDNIAHAVVKYSERYGVPTNLILATMTVESAFDPTAVSPVGAMGLLQVMPRTADEIAKELRVEEFNLTNIDTNIRFGTYYLHKMLKTFDGDTEKAIRAYNTGADNVSKERYLDETIAYHKSVIGMYQWLETRRLKCDSSD